MTEEIRPAARKPAAGKSAARTPAARQPTKKKPAARKPAAKRRTTSKRRTTRRTRTSTASTLGTAVGAALAGIIVALVAGMPWWGWVLVAVVVLAAGVGYLVTKVQAAEQPEDPAAP